MQIFFRAKFGRPAISGFYSFVYRRLRRGFIFSSFVRGLQICSVYFTLARDFFLFFRFPAVGQVFIHYYRGGWKRMEEDGRGRRGWLCALGAEHVAEQMVDGSDGV